MLSQSIRGNSKNDTAISNLDLVPLHYSIMLVLTLSMTPILFLFDIDGTLTQSVSTYHQVITNAMQQLGISNIDTDYDNYKHHTDSYALAYNYKRHFGKEASLSLRDQLDDLLAQEMKNHPPVYEISGAQSFLNHLKEQQLPVAFGTGAFPKATAIKMKDAQLPYEPSVLATSKTSITREGFVQQAINQAKKHYGIEQFEKIISFGDGLWDLYTAQNLGLEFVGVGQAKEKALKQAGCGHWIPNYNGFTYSQFV